jgi:TorA maturation chaperone TorD
VSQPRAAAEARSGTYRLLARLTLAEVDDELARGLDGLPIFGQALADSGGRSGLQALRVDYTRLFLLNAHPYESVYLDESGMLNAPGSGPVLAEYQASGFDSAWLRRTGAPDHVGLELEYLAALVEAEAAALEQGDARQAERAGDAQRAFLAEHLLRWAPLLGQVLVEQAETPFYRHLGEALQNFILGEYQALATEE